MVLAVVPDDLLLSVRHAASLPTDNTVIEGDRTAAMEAFRVLERWTIVRSGSGEDDVYFFHNEFSDFARKMFEVTFGRCDRELVMCRQTQYLCSFERIKRKKSPMNLVKSWEHLSRMGGPNFFSCEQPYAELLSVDNELFASLRFKALDFFELICDDKSAESVIRRSYLHERARDDAFGRKETEVILLNLLTNRRVAGDHEAANGVRKELYDIQKKRASDGWIDESLLLDSLLMMAAKSSPNEFDSRLEALVAAFFMKHGATRTATDLRSVSNDMFNRGMPREAERLYRVLLRLAKDNPRLDNGIAAHALHGVGKCKRTLGSLGEANAILEQIPSMDRISLKIKGYCFLEMSRCFFDTGRYVEGVAMLSSAQLDDSWLLLQRGKFATCL